MRHPRFPRRSRRWWLRASLLVLLDLLVAVVVGVTTASVHGSFGPHEARYEVTTDSTVTIDVGPLGRLLVRSPLPLTLGVRATVEEIPDTLTSVDPATTLAALSGDLQSYVQFFSAPQSTVHDVTLALVADAAMRAAVTALLLAGLWFLGRWLLGPARRAEPGDHAVGAPAPGRRRGHRSRRVRDRADLEHRTDPEPLDRGGLARVQRHPAAGRPRHRSPRWRDRHLRRLRPVGGARERRVLPGRRPGARRRVGLQARRSRRLVPAGYDPDRDPVRVRRRLDRGRHRLADGARTPGDRSRAAGGRPGRRRLRVADVRERLAQPVAHARPGEAWSPSWWSPTCTATSAWRP